MTAFQAAVARRLASMDPLLPAQVPPEQAFSGPSAGPPCEVRFTVTGSSGKPMAVGHCAHWTGTPGSLDLVWGKSRRYTLLPEIAGPDVAEALDQLIDQWRDHLATVPGADDEDTAAIINWPSRDIEGVNTMLARGLTPLNIVAAKRLKAAAPPQRRTQQSDGFRIRPATHADLDVLTSLSVAELRYDAHFGGVIERPHTAAAMRIYLTDLLADPDTDPDDEPWIWLAERAGTTLGHLIAEPPAAATWIAPLTGLSPVAYLTSAYVDPAERGAGIGRALTGEFHRAAQDEGVGVVLLHYELLNPHSGPFWAQQGYRPLWTAFEARPVTRLIGHSI